MVGGGVIRHPGSKDSRMVVTLLSLDAALCAATARRNSADRVRSSRFATARNWSSSGAGTTACTTARGFEFVLVLMHKCYIAVGSTLMGASPSGGHKASSIIHSSVQVIAAWSTRKKTTMRYPAAMSFVVVYRFSRISGVSAVPGLPIAMVSSRTSRFSRNRASPVSTAFDAGLPFGAVGNAPFPRRPQRLARGKSV